MLRRETYMISMEKRELEKVVEEWVEWTYLIYWEEEWEEGVNKEDLRRERLSCIKSKLLLKICTMERQVRL
jgi:hypothetical protein